MHDDTTPRSALDAHLDDAARSVETTVADYVAPPFDPSARPARRSSAAAATAVAAVLLLLAGVVAANGNLTYDGDEVARDVDDTTAPTIDRGVGGPRDGLDSLRLPVEVTPADGLADGQVVTVRGSQFPPNRALGVVMCVGYANREPAGSNNCQLTPYTSVTSDAQGNFEIGHPVDRVFTTSGGEHIDCAEATEEWTCLVAVGALDDYDQSGIAQISFDPSLPAVPDPFVALDDPGPYQDGQVVTVTIGHVAPGAEYILQMCVEAGSDGYACVPVAGGAVIADGDGAASVAVTLRRKFDPGFGTVDCGSAGVWCSLEVFGPQVGSWFDLQFVGGEPRTTDTTTVTPGTPPPAPPEPTTTTAPSTPSTQAPTTTTAPSTQGPTTTTTARVTTTTSG